MYFLADTFTACENSGLLKVIYFGSLILDIAFTLLPICLIILLMIDFGKAVISPSEEEQIKSTKLVGKRILYCILVFATPWIVDFIFSVLNTYDLGVEYTACLPKGNANPEKIAVFEAIEEAEEEKEAAELVEKNKQDNQGSSSNTPSGDSYEQAAASMVSLAKGELGHVGGSKYGTSSAWCAYFVVWCMKNTNVSGQGSVFDIIQKEGKVASVGGAGGTIGSFWDHSNLDFYYSKHYGGNYTPKAGDVIYFWYPSRNSNQDWNKSLSSVLDADHVGLVEYFSDDRVYAIEGNTGNKVNEQSYALNDGSIMGYGSWYK